MLNLTHVNAWTLVFIVCGSISPLVQSMLSKKAIVQLKSNQGLRIDLVNAQDLIHHDLEGEVPPLHGRLHRQHIVQVRDERGGVAHPLVVGELGAARSRLVHVSDPHFDIVKLLVEALGSPEHSDLANGLINASKTHMGVISIKNATEF